MNPILSRLLALGLGSLLAFVAIKEPVESIKDTGSFFILSNPSPKPIGDHLNDLVSQAKKSVDIQIYSFSDPTLIKIINNKSGYIPTKVYYDIKASPDLRNKLSDKVFSYPYSNKALMHRKICGLDDTLTLLGSTNYTPSSLYWHYNALIGVYSKKLYAFLDQRERGFCDFELGRAYLLPDIKNRALCDLINRIEEAKDTIYLAMFSLTHPKLLEALIGASNRGVKIYLYIDKLNTQNPSPLLAKLIECSFEVMIQKEPVLLHHKLCLIDEKTLIAGSANWTKSGLKKNEEVLVIFDKLQVVDQLKCKLVFDTLKKELILFTLHDRAA